MKNEEGVFILICALLVTGAIWGFAKWIGADPTITFAAIGYSVLVLAIGVAIWFLIHPKLDVLACVTATALWPCWWGVIDSIAAGGKDPEKLMFRPVDVIWWRTSYFKAGVLIGMLSLVGYLWFVKHERDIIGY